MFDKFFPAYIYRGDNTPSIQRLDYGRVQVIGEWRGPLAGCRNVPVEFLIVGGFDILGRARRFPCWRVKIDSKTQSAAINPVAGLESLHGDFTELTPEGVQCAEFDDTVRGVGATVCREE